MLKRVATAALFGALCFGLSDIAAGASAQEVGDAQAPDAGHPGGKKRKRKKGSKKKKKRNAARAAKKKETDPLSYEFRSFIELGFQHGYGIRRFDSAYAALGASWTESLVLGPFEFEVPLTYEQLQIPGAALREHTGATSAKITWKPSKLLRPFAELGLLGVWRPNWPDLYQPLPSGELKPTDRFSYFRRSAEFGVRSRFGRSTTARTSYTYTLWDYENDPAFEPVEAPTHLVPSDHEEHLLRLSLGTHFDALRLRGSCEAFERNYFFLFARDRWTGKTHAGPGGPPPNPLYQTRGLAPAGSIELRAATIALRGSYGLEFIQDTFQGYYSSTAHHPEIDVRWSPSEQLSFSAETELWSRAWGLNSYREGSGHPPLTFGTQRADRLYGARLETAYRLIGDFRLIASSEARLRRTNFPNYVPGVFPRGAAYDITWNYDNWRVGLSLEYRRVGSDTANRSEASERDL